MTVSDWIQAVGILLIASIAIFQDKIRAWLKRPNLDVSIDLIPPYCHKELAQCVDEHGGLNEADCYYFRLRVKNGGNEAARMVEVYALELLKEQADGSFKKMDSFIPMNLKWSHIGKPFRDAISPGMEKLCDLGHIFDPTRRWLFPMEADQRLAVEANETIFSFDVECTSFTMSHLIPPATYRLDFLVGADNTGPISKMLEINLTGKWYEDERKMLGEGIVIRML